MTQEDNIDRAKKIFFDYGTSKFQIMRDGLISEYSSYNISVEQERIWTQELVQKEFNKLNINDPETLFPLWYILQTNCLDNYIEKIIEFIRVNQTVANSTDSLKQFIVKTYDVIEKIEDGCKHRPVLVGHYKQKLDDLKNVILASG